MNRPRRPLQAHQNADGSFTVLDARRQIWFSAERFARLRELHDVAILDGPAPVLPATAPVAKTGYSQDDYRESVNDRPADAA